MVSKRNHRMYRFLITIDFHLANFYAQNTLKKLAREMLLIQNIEFELRGLESPCRTCTSIIG